MADTLSCRPLLSHGIFPLCVLSSLYEDTSRTVMVTLLQYNLILTDDICTTTLFADKVTFRGTEGQDFNVSLFCGEGYNSAHTTTIFNSWAAEESDPSGLVARQLPGPPEVCTHEVSKILSARSDHVRTGTGVFLFLLFCWFCFYFQITLILLLSCHRKEISLLQVGAANTYF